MTTERLEREIKKPTIRICRDPERHRRQDAWVYRESSQQFVCARCYPPDTPCSICNESRWLPYTAQGPAAPIPADSDSGAPYGYGFVCGKCHPSAQALSALKGVSA